MLMNVNGVLVENYGVPMIYRHEDPALPRKAFELDPRYANFAKGPRLRRSKLWENGKISYVPPPFLSDDGLASIEPVKDGLQLTHDERGWQTWRFEVVLPSSRHGVRSTFHFSQIGAHRSTAICTLNNVGDLIWDMDFQESQQIEEQLFQLFGREHRFLDNDVPWQRLTIPDIRFLIDKFLQLFCRAECSYEFNKRECAPGEAGLYYPDLIGFHPKGCPDYVRAFLAAQRFESRT